MTYLRTSCRRCKRLTLGLMREAGRLDANIQHRGDRVQRADLATSLADYRDSLRYHFERDHA